MTPIVLKLRITVRKRISIKRQAKIITLAWTVCLLFKVLESDYYTQCRTIHCREQTMIVNEIKEKNGVLRKCFRQDFFLYRFVFNGHITNSNRYLLTEPINR